MSGGSAADPSRRLARWAAGLSLLPIPVWFVVGAALEPAPAWRAEYRSHAAAAVGSAPVEVTRGEGTTADGEAAQRETAGGEAADGETADGETADGETADGETADGETGKSQAAGGTGAGSPVTGISPAETTGVVMERELQHYWDRNNKVVPPGIDVLAFSARYDACLSVDAAVQFPVMLVADGAASFAVDGVERLRVESSKRRGTRGEMLELSPGAHRLSVEFAAHGWSSVALLASFDGRAPKAIGSGSLAPGVSVHAPRAGADPCAAR